MVSITDPLPVDIYDLRDFPFDPQDQTSLGFQLRITLYNGLTEKNPEIEIEGDYISFVIMLAATQIPIAIGLLYNMEMITAEVGTIDLLADKYVYGYQPGIDQIIEAALPEFIAQPSETNKPLMRITIR